ncbi:hypothetical protein D3C78_1892430 [compost metagenome]
MAEQVQQGKGTQPAQGQQYEIARLAQGRARRWLADQLIDLVGGPIGAQAPGIDHMAVQA